MGGSVIQWELCKVGMEHENKRLSIRIKIMQDILGFMNTMDSLLSKKKGKKEIVIIP